MCKALEDMRDEYLQIGIQQGVKQGMEQGIQQGEKNGEKKRSREVASRMLRAGKYASDEIADVSGLTLAEVQGLRAEATA